MRTKPYLRASAACAMLLALVACTSANDSPVTAPPPIGVDFSPVDVPTEMRSPTSTVWGVSAVAATAELPMVIAGLRADPGMPPAVALWTYSGGAPKRTSIDVGLAGAAQSATVASSSELTALAGHFWKDGATEAFLMTSADRATWHRVSLPDPEQVRVGQVVVVGSTAYAVGEGTGESLLGYAAADGEAVRFHIPDLEDGCQRTLVGIAGHGNELVVVAEEGPPDETRVPVVYRSPDVGRTWTGPHVIQPDAQVSASGIVWTGSTYIITGSAEVAGDTAKARQPAAWSGDGSGWTAETMPSVWPDSEGPTADAGLSAPASSGVDGAAAVAVWRERQPQTSALRRGADGHWTLLGESTAGTSLAAGGTSVIGEDGQHFVVTESQGAAVLHRVTADAEWINAGRLAPRSDWFSADGLLDTSAGLRVHTSKRYLSITDDGWRSGSTGAVFTLRAKRLTRTEWEPAALNGPGELTAARGTDGSEVIMSTDWGADHATVVVTGAYRPRPDAPWHAVVGFPTEGASGVSSVLWTGQDWVATGYVSEGPGAHQPSEPAIWTSPDGISWARSTEGLDLVGQDSSITQPCVMPDGTPLVIGKVVVDGEDQATAWRRDAGLWSRVTVPTITGDGRFTGCVTTADGLVARRESDGPDALWRTRDGVTFERIFAVAPGDAMLEVEAVPGGFAAYGAIDTREYAGPALWLSRDGEDWSSVPVPVRENAATALIAADGPDLLVIASTSSGEQALGVAGIEQVIADVAAQDG